MRSDQGTGRRPWGRVAALAATAALTVGALPAQAVTPAAAPAATGAPAYVVAPSANTLYVAKVNKGNVQSLVVASRATGAVVRTVASGKVVGGNNVFEDVDLAPDGTVWAVQATRGAYASKLVKYAPGKRGVAVMPYVVAARVSPDGRQLAVSVISPDADHDGKGTASVRVGPVGGSKFTTLGSSTFAVDAKTGDPTQQIAAPIVAGWLGTSALVVEWGCCDDGNVAVIPATRPTAMSTWKALNGDGSTSAIGLLPRGRVLVLRDRIVGDGIKVPLRTVGKEAVSMGANGKGWIVWSGKPKDDSTRAWLRLTDQIVAATRAVPLEVTRVRFPFKGAGFVTAAYI